MHDHSVMNNHFSFLNPIMILQKNQSKKVGVLQEQLIINESPVDFSPADIVTVTEILKLSTSSREIHQNMEYF